MNQGMMKKYIQKSSKFQVESDEIMMNVAPIELKHDLGIRKLV